MEHTKETHNAGGLLPFDPIVVVMDVARRWLLILLAAVLVGTCVYIKTDRDYVPQYSASATFVVTAQGSSTTVYSNLSSATSVATVFSDLLNSSLMRKTVLNALGETWFDGSISTSTVPETNLINMTVTSPDPRMAFLVAKTIIREHETITYQVVDGVVLEVLRQPTVPVYPGNSSGAMNSMKRAVVFTAAAIVAVLALLSFCRDGVRSASEARKKLEWEYLGELPHENKYKTLAALVRRRKTSILINNPVTGFRFVESVRKLRRRVEQGMGKGKVLMVTSILENEGKSTVAANLALAMAQKHSKVLLIDCDLRKPACHAVLEQAKTGSGIREVLRDSLAPQEAVTAYEGTNLDLMLARKADVAACDLIISQRMNAVLNWARENYDFVILDLPPMVAASDAEGMKKLADGCLLVVRQSVGQAKAVNAACGNLSGGRAKMLGCVLNNVYETRTFSRSGYGYRRYGYGYYGHYGHYGHYGRYGYGKKNR